MLVFLEAFHVYCLVVTFWGTFCHDPSLGGFTHSRVGAQELEMLGRRKKDKKETQPGGSGTHL